MLSVSIIKCWSENTRIINFTYLQSKTHHGQTSESSARQVSAIIVKIVIKEKVLISNWYLENIF